MRPGVDPLGYDTEKTVHGRVNNGKIIAVIFNFEWFDNTFIIIQSPK